MDVTNVREYLAHLAALQVSDEVPREAARVCLHLVLEVLSAILAEHLEARVREHLEFTGGDVLDRGQDLHFARGAPGAGDLGPHPLEVLAHLIGAKIVDQLNHAMPACRPVTPWSLRWEKNSESSEQIVQRPTSYT